MDSGSMKASPLDLMTAILKMGSQQIMQQGFTNDLLRAKTGINGFKTSNVGVFYLRNRQYEHFNKVGKEIDQLFAEQDAKHIVSVGLGDDDQCMEDDSSACLLYLL